MVHVKVLRGIKSHSLEKRCWGNVTMTTEPRYHTFTLLSLKIMHDFKNECYLFTVSSVVNLIGYNDNQWIKLTNDIRCSYIPVTLELGYSIRKIK